MAIARADGSSSRFDGAFVTRDVPGIGGVLRAAPEDFEVEERLAREPRGRGEVAWVRIEKRGISTKELLRRVAVVVAPVPSREIRAAGLKDANAVARQWISLPWSALPQLVNSRKSDFEILTTERDDAPLSPSLVAANAFRLTIRDCDASDAGLARARTIVATLESGGVPHFFGAQRFGVRGESAAVGAALLAGDHLRALDLVLGFPSPREHDPRAAVFRAAYAERDFERALANCPGALRLERRLLEGLAKGRSRGAVAREMPEAERRFYLSAWQALHFNRVIARRIRSTASPASSTIIGTALEGDIFADTEGNPIATIDEAAVREWRASPTGPLFGDRVTLATGEPGAIERAVLREAGFESTALLAARTGLPLAGERRPLRVRTRVTELGRVGDDRTVAIAFELPSGAFATTLVGELMKTEPPIVESPALFDARPA